MINYTLEVSFSKTFNINIFIGDQNIATIITKIPSNIIGVEQLLHSIRTNESSSNINIIDDLFIAYDHSKELLTFKNNTIQINVDMFNSSENKILSIIHELKRIDNYYR